MKRYYRSLVLVTLTLGGAGCAHHKPAARHLLHGTITGPASSPAAPDVLGQTATPVRPGETMAAYLGRLARETGLAIACTSEQLSIPTRELPPHGTIREIATTLAQRSGGAYLLLDNTLSFVVAPRPPRHWPAIGDHDSAIFEFQTSFTAPQLAAMARHGGWLPFPSLTARQQKRFLDLVHSGIFDLRMPKPYDPAAISVSVARCADVRAASPGGRLLPWLSVYNYTTGEVPRENVPPALAAPEAAPTGAVERLSIPVQTLVPFREVLSRLERHGSVVPAAATYGEPAFFVTHGQWQVNDLAGVVETVYQVVLTRTAAGLAVQPLPRRPQDGALLGHQGNHAMQTWLRTRNRAKSALTVVPMPDGFGLTANSFAASIRVPFSALGSWQQAWLRNVIYSSPERTVDYNQLDLPKSTIERRDHVWVGGAYGTGSFSYPIDE